MATKGQITALIRMNIPKIIEEISKKLNMCIDEAMEKFYNSVTYNVLKDIESDLWTYSYLYIADEYFIELGLVPREQ